MRKLAAWIFLTITVSILIGLFMGFIYVIKAVPCVSKWDEVRKPEYGFLSGCTILHKGERIPADNLKLE